MITPLNQREIFHLAFLRQLCVKLKPNSFAVKGGVNLRFFFDSQRYSEDMDLDIKNIETFKLKEIVLNIILSKSLNSFLKSYQIIQIIPPNMDVAKQTETTQRFKVHLINENGDDLFTKIEFSKRSLESTVVTETVSNQILKKYNLPPILAPHYPASTAIAQKISALAGRSETQARDIFDLYILSSKLSDFHKETIPKSIVKKANDKVFNVTFKVFRDTVIPYLSEEEQEIYNQSGVWENMQLKVSLLIEGII